VNESGNERTNEGTYYVIFSILLILPLC